MSDDKVLVSRELLERVTNPANEVAGRNARIELADLLDQSSDGALTNDGAEPVALTAVAVLRDDGDGGLEPDWLLEGGTAELFEGMTLLVADDAPDLCLEDGHADLYRRPAAPASVVLPERRTQDGWQSLTSQDLGWNACLDRVKELNS